jgi:hypothetical protein
VNQPQAGAIPVRHPSGASAPLVRAARMSFPRWPRDRPARTPSAALLRALCPRGRTDRRRFPKPTSCRFDSCRGRKSCYLDIDKTMSTKEDSRKSKTRASQIARHHAPTTSISSSSEAWSSNLAATAETRHFARRSTASATSSVIFARTSYRRASVAITFVGTCRTRHVSSRHGSLEA